MRLQEASLEMTQAAYATDGDRRLLVKFGLFPEHDVEASAKEGRPIFKEREYVWIMVPGDKETIVHRPVIRVPGRSDPERFPQQWQAFLNKQTQETAGGTPLREVSFISSSQVKELEYFNCYTVEQLANMPDSASIKFMAVHKLKQLAKDYLQAAKETAPLTAMRAEMEKKDSQLEVMQRQLDAMAKRLGELETEDA
jgi:hypothetical protein